MLVADQNSNKLVPANESARRYLLFRLDQELFATPLGDIKELVEKIPYKVVPNTSNYLLGVINLKGQIVTVLDLRVRFNLKTKNEINTYIIFQNKSGNLAALVDNIEAIEKFLPSQIEQSNMLKTEVPQEYLYGVIQYKEENVTVIDLMNLMSNSETNAIQDNIIKEAV